MKLRNIISTICIVVFLDQLTKILFTNKYYTIFGFPIISYTENTGAAFNILQGYGWFLITATVIALLILFYYTTKIREGHKASHIMVGMLMGGMIGNLIDRMFFGYVKDFINFEFWPTFNIADAAMFMAIILLVLYFIKNKHQ